MTPQPRAGKGADRSRVRAWYILWDNGKRSVVVADLNTDDVEVGGYFSSLVKAQRWVAKWIAQRARKGDQ